MLRVSGRNFGVAGEEQSRSFVTNRQSRKCPRDTSRKYQLFLNYSNDAKTQIHQEKQNVAFLSAAPPAGKHSCGNMYYFTVGIWEISFTGDERSSIFWAAGVPWPLFHGPQRVRWRPPVCGLSLFCRFCRFCRFPARLFWTFPSLPWPSPAPSFHT